MNQPISSPATEGRDGKTRFRHVALVGKYHAVGSRDALERLAEFLHSMACEVSLERETALNTGLTQYNALTPTGIGTECDLALVMGGDGTMIGIGRQLARFGVPVVGINQGRLGFITDIPFKDFETHLRPILRGEYEEDHRGLIHASVWRDGDCVFDTVAINDVVVNRGGAASMIELRVEVDGRFVANQRADGLIIASPTGSTAYAVGRRLAAAPGHRRLDHGADRAAHALEPPDRAAGQRRDHARTGQWPRRQRQLRHADLHKPAARRQNHGAARAYKLCLLHPVGWSYFDTLRKKLHWNEGMNT